MKMNTDEVTRGRNAMARQTARGMLPILFAILLMLVILPSTVQAAPKLKLNKTKATVYVGSRKL